MYFEDSGLSDSGSASCDLEDHGFEGLWPCLDGADEEACQRAIHQIRMVVGDERRALVAALRGRVCELAKSAHGHTVLEVVVGVAGTRDAAFIAEELLGQRPESLLHPSTCSVIRSLLEHSPTDSGTLALVGGLLSNGGADLCCHKCGHEVAAAILSAGLLDHSTQIVGALLCNPQRFARHRFAHKVIRVALLTGQAECCETLGRELCFRPGSVSSLACHNFGVHVVRALLQRPRQSKHAFQDLFKTSRRLLKDKYGRELMRDLGLATPAVQNLRGA